MAVATAAADGRPSARMMLMASYDERGFVFYTNYLSRKGQELAVNPRAALIFWWAQLERQVRIEGLVEQVTSEESDAYYNSRPHGNRLAAWASDQSEVIESRDVLERRMEELGQRFPDEHVPRPPHWGGYRLVPQVMEFWRQGPHRVHDRWRCEHNPDGTWTVQRLAP